VEPINEWEARKTDSMIEGILPSQYDFGRRRMEITYRYCAGLDVHKKTVTACCLIPGGNSKEERQIRTFLTMSRDLLALSDWLSPHGMTHVAMERYWRILEARVQLIEG
jgi:hypothetical protein